MIISKNLRHLSHLDIPGGGQVVVQNNTCFVGHMKPPHGTSLIDISDPKNPSVISKIKVESPYSHTHKVRVSEDVMITNVEQNNRHFLRKSFKLNKFRNEFNKLNGNLPSNKILENQFNLNEKQISELDDYLIRGYDEGGFKIWDISNLKKPRLLNYQKTFGFGTHRFDMDNNYAYISTEMKGFLGNILVIYDIKNPAEPKEISKWWLDGQNIDGGEKPTWEGYGNRLHHALRVGNELWAAVWHAGFRVIDISNIEKPKTIGSYNYHPWVVEPTHTILPILKPLSGKRIAIAADEEHDHRLGQPHAGLWVFDISNIKKIEPIATFHVSELDSPYSRNKGRFGMHQFQEHLEDGIIFCAWFSGGLRVVDVSRPSFPEEIGYFIPNPPNGEASPQSNDVDVDNRGLVYLLDRNRGLDILEYKC